MPAVSAPKLAFGSTQDRKLFPVHYAPDRLGNELSRQTEPHLGPGCHDNHEFGTIIYNLEKTPGSKRGYGLSARTAVRFPLCNKSATPSPQQYQPDQSKLKVLPPGKFPFSSTTQRFQCAPCTARDTPGPGSYAQEAVRNRKVSWPMRFGSPDWSRLPQLQKKSLRVKLTDEREFHKRRNRLAYLSLYY